MGRIRPLLFAQDETLTIPVGGIVVLVIGRLGVQLLLGDRRN